MCFESEYCDNYTYNLIYLLWCDTTHCVKYAAYKMDIEVIDLISWTKNVNTNHDQRPLYQQSLHCFL